MRRLPLALAAAFVLAGVMAPGASAVQFCVQFAGPVCEDSSNATLQGALNAAGATTADDVIHIGPVTISEDPNGPNGPGFDYTSTAGAGNDVTLIGQGTGQTTIQRSNDREFGTFTTSTNSHVTFQDLAIFVVGNTMFDSSAFNGLRVQTGGATLTRVRVTAQDLVLSHAFNSGVRLVLASGPLTMSDSTIDGADNGNAECLTSTAFNTPVVIATEFVDCDFGVRAVASSNPSIDSSTFTNVNTGAQVENGASISINRSRFIGGGGNGLYALNFSSFGVFRLDNSLVARAADSGGILVAPTAGNEADGTVNQSTLVGSGVSNVGLAVSNTTGDSADVKVFDSIITGFNTPILAVSGGTATTEYSFYDFASSTHTPIQGNIDSQGDTVNPGFVNALASDYGLASTSILRDRDPLTTARLGEVITTDLAGGNRISNGARDVGAYEFQFVPPPPVITPPTPTPTATPTGQRAAALKKCKKKKTKRARRNCETKAKKLPL